MFKINLIKHSIIEALHGAYAITAARHADRMSRLPFIHASIPEVSTTWTPAIQEMDSDQIN